MSHVCVSELDPDLFRKGFMTCCIRRLIRQHALVFTLSQSMFGTGMMLATSGQMRPGYSTPWHVYQLCWVSESSCFMPSVLLSTMELLCWSRVGYVLSRYDQRLYTITRIASLMGPSWGRQAACGSHVCPMDRAISVRFHKKKSHIKQLHYSYFKPRWEVAFRYNCIP